MLPTEMIPGLLPGLIVPPLLITTSPRVPMPPSVPPLLTAVALRARLPLTRSLPALMAVEPIKLCIALRVSVPIPALMRLPLPLIPPV